MSSPIETTAVEAVAKALWDADDMAAKPDFAWDETTRASYRRMAEAAVAALRLTSETRTYEATEVKAVVGGEGGMRYGGQAIRSLGWRTASRLVSPWVEGNQP